MAHIHLIAPVEAIADKQSYSDEWYVAIEDRDGSRLYFPAADEDHANTIAKAINNNARQDEPLDTSAATDAQVAGLRALAAAE